MNEQTAVLVGLWVILVAGILAIIGYIVMSAILWRLGRKFQEEDFLAYCIPVYQWVLMCRCANISGWHAAALFVPILNCGATVWIFGNIARRMGRSFWGYGIGALFLVPLLVLAFGNAKPVADDGRNPEEPVTPAGERRYLLSCVQGEIAGTRIEIPAGSLVIGRNPHQAQIVLSHPHVSALHVRVWTEVAAGGSRIWMEDLNSMNGTSFRRDMEQGWTVLKGSGIPLCEGDMIRIADGVAEFRLVGD